LFLLLIQSHFKMSDEFEGYTVLVYQLLLNYEILMGKFDKSRGYL